MGDTEFDRAGTFLEPFAENRASGRDSRGRFAAGNVVALKHGGRSVRVRAALLPEQRGRFETLAIRRAAIVADLGGEEAVSTIKADLVSRYLEVATVAEWLGGNLITEGPLTCRGRARAATTLFLQTVDRLHRLGATLGVETPHEVKPTIVLFGGRYGENSEQDQQETGRASLRRCSGRNPKHAMIESLTKHTTARDTATEETGQQSDS
jgi:hypothetical protein